MATPNFPPEFLGGTERVTLALARAFRDAGDDVVVITGSDRPHDGTDLAREELDGIDVRRLRRLPEEVYGLDVRRPRLQALIDGVLVAERVEVGRALQSIFSARPSARSVSKSSSRTKERSSMSLGNSPLTFEPHNAKRTGGETVRFRYLLNGYTSMSSSSSRLG